MHGLLNKEIISAEDIIELINNNISESLNLVFKDGNEISVTDEKKIIKLIISLTALANTKGGILIYGINAKRKKANQLSLINDKTINEESLFYLVNNNIFRNIKNINIQQIEFNQNQSVVIFIIPESIDVPHMASDGCYYKRQQFKDVLMEEHEVRMYYNKSSITEIEFLGIVNTAGVPTLSDGKFSFLNFYPKFMIRNTGNTIEHFYKIELFIPSSLHDSMFQPLQNYFNRLSEIYSVFSIPNRVPLFQQEIATVVEAKLTVNAENFNEFINRELIVKIYYTNGVKEHLINLSQTFFYNNKKIDFNDFLALNQLQ